MYECESWTIKKAEHWRIDAFELWCWRRLLRIPCKETARRCNHSILKEISPGYSLEALMLKLLKLQYFGHLMQTADSFEKTLILGKSEGRRRRGWQRIRWLDGITDWMDMGLDGLWEFTQTHVYWVSDAIQSSYPLSSLFPPAFSLSQLQGLFQWVSSLHQVTKVLEFQLQHQSFLPVNIQDWLPLGWTGRVSLRSKGLSRVFSNTTVQKLQFFCTQLSL